MEQFRIEVTDTFGGEANYCWVHRYRIEVPDNSMPGHIVRKAKAAEGWTGVKCSKDSRGDTITLVPRGMCRIMFIDWFDPSVDNADMWPLKEIS